MEEPGSAYGSKARRVWVRGSSEYPNAGCWFSTDFSPGDLWLQSFATSVVFSSNSYATSFSPGGPWRVGNAPWTERASAAVVASADGTTVFVGGGVDFQGGQPTGVSFVRCFVAIHLWFHLLFVRAAEQLVFTPPPLPRCRATCGLWTLQCACSQAIQFSVTAAARQMWTRSPATVLRSGQGTPCAAPAAPILRAQAANSAPQGTGGLLALPARLACMEPAMVGGRRAAQGCAPAPVVGQAQPATSPPRPPPPPPLRPPPLRHQTITKSPPLASPRAPRRACPSPSSPLQGG